MAVTKTRAVLLPAAPVTPFLKWAGGKRQLLDRFATLYPPSASVSRYLEPFLGGGAVFFHVQRTLTPRRVLLFDSNKDLINAYLQVKNNVDAVLAALKRLRSAHDKDHYYEVRERDPAKMSPAERAARLIYLNKTCFNGLYRVNGKNQFNVPMGSYVRPRIFDEANMRAAHAHLRNANLAVADFRTAARRARAHDFVYFDPPYDPVSSTAGFTSYTRQTFSKDDQRALADVFRTLHEMKCKVMLSNSDTALVRSLYKGFDIRTVRARRSINRRADGRGPVNEIVVLNYRPGA